MAKHSEYLDVYGSALLVAENSFIRAAPNRSPPPKLTEVKPRLPHPFWEGHASAIDCYWKVWELAFDNIRAVTPENGFIEPYIDTAFNRCLFEWDSCFIMMFAAKYGHRGFDFIKTLDNLYAKQHPDGFISREVTQWSGWDRFHRHDPASTGPNILAWCEWEHYTLTHDRVRLARVLPVLLAYHAWLRRYRTWPDGSYFSCGLACGMDNQPRVDSDCSAWIDHSHQAWIDATAQALLSANTLVAMAEELGWGDKPEVAACREEVTSLRRYIHDHMWDDSASTFADRKLKPSAAGTDKSNVATVGAYWTLMADAVSADRLFPFLHALDDTTKFNRPVRVPSLAADHPMYHPTGGYWLGGVWAPTNYMVMRGCTRVGADDLAADIGRNYHDNVVRLFTATGTVWENMAPELGDVTNVHTSGVAHGPRPGSPSKPDFVGWSGIAPVAVLFEYVFGLRPEVPRGRLTWDIRLLDGFGVSQYPFGTSGTLELACQGRASLHEPPVITLATTTPLRLVVQWGKSATVLGGVEVERDAIISSPAHEVVVDVPAGFHGVMTAVDGRLLPTAAGATGAASAPATGGGGASHGPVVVDGAGGHGGRSGEGSGTSNA